MEAYFAHPCFNRDQLAFKKAFLEKLAALKGGRDIQIVDPFEGTPIIEDDHEIKLCMAGEVKTRCLRLLEECHIIVALADWNDTGVAFETGYAHHLGKPVILISRGNCLAANAMLVGAADAMIDDILNNQQMERLIGYLEG